MSRAEQIQEALCKAIVKTRLKRALDPQTPPARKRRILDQAALLTPAAPGTKTSMAKIGHIPACWIEPAKVSDPSQVILYIHGGGFVTGSIKSHTPLVSHLAKASSTRALLIDYRLAPENPYPAACDDVSAAYEWLLAEGFDSSSIILAGDSAGGFLSIQQLLHCKRTSTAMPAGAVLFSPLTNAIHFDGESYNSRKTLDPWLRHDNASALGQQFLGASAAPEWFAADRIDVSDLPPVLVQVGDHEILLSDSVDFVKNALACGVQATLSVYPGMWHVFQAFSMLVKPGRVALQEAGSFTRQVLG